MANDLEIPDSTRLLVGLVPPQQLTETRRPQGARNARWLMRQLRPGERAIVEAALERLEQRMLPAHPVRIIEHLARLAVHWKKDRKEPEWTMIFHDYVEDLREFSEPQIIEAIAEHRQTKNWWPKSAELRSIAERIACMDREYRRRAWVLLGMQRPFFLDVPDEPERGSVRDMTPVLRALTNRVNA